MKRIRGLEMRGELLDLMYDGRDCYLAWPFFMYMLAYSNGFFCRLYF